MADVAHSYIAYPGQCWVCGGSNPEKGIMDLGNLPGSQTNRWRLYLCGECVVGFASQIGGHVGAVVIPVAEYERLRILAGQADHLFDMHDLSSRLHALAEELVQ